MESSPQPVGPSAWKWSPSGTRAGTCRSECTGLQGMGSHGSRRDADGVVLPNQPLHGGSIDVRAREHFDAGTDDQIDLLVDHVGREAELGDAVAHPAAQTLLTLEQGDIMVQSPQFVCSRQSGRTAADDGYLPAGGAVPGGRRLNGPRGASSAAARLRWQIDTGPLTFVQLCRPRSGRGWP